MLLQLSQLQSCPLLPDPPPGSYLLQLLRVPRPLLLPSPRFKVCNGGHQQAVRTPWQAGRACTWLVVIPTSCTAIGENIAVLACPVQPLVCCELPGGGVFPGG